MNIVINNITEPTLISSLIQHSDNSYAMPCGGAGTCKKCRVTVKGNTSPITPVETNCFTEEEIKSGVRLACQTYVTGDVIIDYNNNDNNLQGITFGNMPEFEIKPVCKAGKGAAVDIGTTTIALYMYDFESKSVVAKYSEANEQRKYGADVISRIEYNNQNGIIDLKKTVTSQVSRMISKYCSDVSFTVITGNTTMLHLYCGLDPKGIAVSPFEPKSLFGSTDGNTYFPHCISAYVGADITCAALASGMALTDASSLLIDVGTNGEMALWHNGKLYCCSTAAGPAFEGAGISSGMPGTNGAIDKVLIDNDTIKYTTIGNEKAVGICGSGIIDVTATLLKTGIIDETGVICEYGHDYADYIGEDDEGMYVTIGDSGIKITQNDIRQVQLAKSAICAGIYTLLETCGIDDVSKLYLAGGFGSFINRENAACIGLIPGKFTEKAEVIGNGAGIGALMHLMSTDIELLSKKLATEAEVVELSTSPVFMEKYIDCMMFGE